MYGESSPLNPESFVTNKNVSNVILRLRPASADRRSYGDKNNDTSRIVHKIKNKKHVDAIFSFVWDPLVEANNWFGSWRRRGEKNQTHYKIIVSQKENKSGFLHFFSGYFLDSSWIFTGRKVNFSKNLIFVSRLSTCYNEVQWVM